ncbi:MAG: MBL fold metallo-hydrolase [Chloroflexota bacterium]
MLAALTTITIVYDNYPCDPRFKVGSGFSCVVRSPAGTVLFDTGAYGPTLLHNLEAAGVKPEQIDTLVLSHLDSDHAGGLFKFLEANRRVTVYLLRVVPDPFKDIVRLHGAKVISVTRTTPVLGNVYSLGESGGWMKEQALVVKTESGLVLIMGDAHPGIVALVKKARRAVHGPVHLALGGFHLEGASEAGLRSIVGSFLRLGVARVAPCHSSGNLARRLFQSAYGEGFLEAGVGMELRL